MRSQNQPWENPDPQSVAGLNSQMVYGQNIQFTTGVDHQVALGSSVQLCVNPGTLTAMLGGPESPTLSGFFGAGGLGGHLQFTIGTDTRINWGRQYVVNMGGETIHFEADQQTAASKTICAVIGATAIAHSIAYGICPDEDERASLTILFQSTMDSLLGAFMAYQAALKSGVQTARDALQSMHGLNAAAHTTIWELAGTATAEAATGALEAAVTPVVAGAIEERHFANSPGETQSSS